MCELWKDIPGYSGLYAVSNTGRVKSLSFYQPYKLRNGKKAVRKTKEKILSNNKINSGYLIVHLYKNNKRNAFLVHRLVAEAFIPVDGAEKTEINHIDGDKTNNYVTNLARVTSSENKKHAVELGLDTQAIPVKGICTNTGCEYRFLSMSQAERYFSDSSALGSKVSAAVSGKRKTAYGCVWSRGHG